MKYLLLILLYLLSIYPAFPSTCSDTTHRHSHQFEQSPKRKHWKQALILKIIHKKILKITQKNSKKNKEATFSDDRLLKKTRLALIFSILGLVFTLGVIGFVFSIVSSVMVKKIKNELVYKNIDIKEFEGKKMLRIARIFNLINIIVLSVLMLIALGAFIYLIIIFN